MAFGPIQKVAEADFPTRWGHFRIFGFSRAPVEDASRASGEKSPAPPEEMVALVMGDIQNTPAVVRIHSQCLTGDVFGSLRCDCRQQLELALETISRAGVGVLLYEQQEGRGIGLLPKLQAYALQDLGLDTVEANEQLGFQADYREFDLPAAVLRHLGLTQVRLMTNNPEKVSALESAGIRVVERISAAVEPQESFRKYLQTKHDKMGHLVDDAEVQPSSSLEKNDRHVMK